MQDNASYEQELFRYFRLHLLLANQLCNALGAPSASTSTSASASASASASTPTSIPSASASTSTSTPTSAFSQLGNRVRTAVRGALPIPALESALVLLDTASPVHTQGVQGVHLRVLLLHPSIAMELRELLQ
jgi:hypothetical protein